MARNEVVPPLLMVRWLVRTMCQLRGGGQMACLGREKTIGSNSMVERERVPGVAWAMKKGSEGRLPVRGATSPERPISPEWANFPWGGGTWVHASFQEGLSG